MIQVCDAIMGAGKTSAAITYIKEHSDEKFIYITPYLEEANRIKQECPEMKFAEPSDRIPEYHFKKCEHTAALIKQGRNITTTHQAFKMYSREMLDNIRDNGYNLIIDENIDALEKCEYHPDDLKLLVQAGFVEEKDEEYTLVNDDYNGLLFKDFFKFLRTRSLIKIDREAVQSEEASDDKYGLFYWILPPDLITSFNNVFILTYMFEEQSFHHFLDIHNIPYVNIGLQKLDSRRYRFCKEPGVFPEYISHLEDMIHIVDGKRINGVGDDYHALSMNWYATKDDEIEQLKKNIWNCINNVWKGVPPQKKMWGCYLNCANKIRGKGYTRSFLPFNTKSTNDYRDRQYLVYAVNIFMNVNEKIFYRKNGVDVDDSKYALSIMVQWIWRSAIREGKEIYLYIPSRRMRELLISWIKETSKGVRKVA